MCPHEALCTTLSYYEGSQKIRCKCALRPDVILRFDILKGWILGRGNPSQQTFAVISSGNGTF